jgi:putative Holliday junction resolvase
MRNLGLDVGDKRIGVAVSDPDQILATPLTTVIRDNDDSAIKTIVELVNKYEVQKIIIGFPYSLNGNVGQQAEKTKVFAEKLSQYTKVAIEFRDERLSSAAVDRLFREAGVKMQRRKEQRDAAAATFILQGYLDSLKTLTNDTVY